jgi:SAM-dependent methyltransferase
MRLMIKTVLKSIAPAGSLALYHRARKLTGRDAHARVSVTALRHIARYQFARDYVSGLLVVDVACGNGYGSMILNNALDYRGYDLDPRAIKDARADYPSAVFDVQSIYSLPIGADSVDAVVSFETLEHLPEPRRAMAEIARVLKPGGVVIASIPINHPDRIYHFEVYPASKAASILTSDTSLSIEKWLLQGDMTFAESTPEEIGDGACGTLLAVLRKQQNSSTTR